MCQQLFQVHMAVVSVRGGPCSLEFRRRLVVALAKSCQFVQDGPGADSLEGIITTKYYTAQVQYTIESGPESEAIIAIHDGSDMQSLLHTSEKEMVKLFVTLAEEPVEDAPFPDFLPINLEQRGLCLDQQFEHVGWSTDESCDEHGLARIREALHSHLWSTAVMTGPSISAIHVRGGARSLSFRRRLCEALNSSDEHLPMSSSSSMVPGEIKTKFYHAKVVYCVETDGQPEAIVAVHDGTELSQLLAGDCDRDCVKLFLTFDAEQIMGDDGVPLAVCIPSAIETCLDNGFEHVVWSTGPPPARGEEAEGLWRLREALECNIWSSAVFDTNGCTTDEDPRKNMPQAQVDIPARINRENDALEKVMSDFDDMADSIRKAREFSKRTDISDEERRRHAAEIAMKLLTSLDSGSEDSVSEK